MKTDVKCHFFTHTSRGVSQTKYTPCNASKGGGEKDILGTWNTLLKEPVNLGVILSRDDDELIWVVERLWVYENEIVGVALIFI